MNGPRVVVMGVSGCGKTLVGIALAERLCARFVEGDRLHPHANVAKMVAGIPLTDADRWLWLDAVAVALSNPGPIVVSCSALKLSYRDRLRARSWPPLSFLHLAGDRTTLAERMAGRTGHYMPVSLLDSQLAALEPPSADEALTLPIDMNLSAMVERFISELRREQS